MAALANGAQTLTAGFWFLAQVIPKATGYSFFMLPSTAYNTYQIPIYDNQYPQNPKGADWQASCAKFEGFKAHAWKCMKTVTNPETLEQTQEINESIALFKTPDGIIAFNWVSTEYKGNRKNVGSMANGLSDCIGFVNELIEREMLGGEKF